MNSPLQLLAVLLLAPMAALPASAASKPSRPTVFAVSGTSLLSPDLHDLKLGGKNVADARVSSIRLSGQPFPEALQVETLKRSRYPWNITLATLTTGATRKGDVLLAEASVHGSGSDLELPLRYVAVGPPLEEVRMLSAVHRALERGV